MTPQDKRIEKLEEIAEFLNTVTLTTVEDYKAKVRLMTELASLPKEQSVSDEDIKKQAHAFMAEDDEWLDLQHNFSIVELAATAEHLTDFGIFLIKAMRDGRIKKSN